MEQIKENRIKKIWNYFSTYEKIWFFSIIVLTIVVAIVFPSTVDDLSINPVLIMSLYVADVITNVLCELLIAKQSKWNFIVSLFVEVIEIVTLIVIAERFATMAVTLFFWIPIDIISFINWNKHKADSDETLTDVRTLKGWQEGLVILGIIVWTIGVGYLLTVISPEGILEAGSTVDIVCCYLDALCSAVAIANGLFILFRLKEQWIAWFICTLLESAMNIMLGQWVLLVLKAGYLTNTIYGFVKWTKYIKTKEKKEIESQTIVTDNI